jgi:hypothetical protein
VLAVVNESPIANTGADTAALNAGGSLITEGAEVSTEGIVDTPHSD